MLENNHTIHLTLNGESRAFTVEPQETLLHVLRERAHLTGAKKGCDLGECGACTVIMDGIPVDTCLYMAVMAQGKHITTVEGLAKDGVLNPVQQSFVDHGAVQCGFCTSGLVLTATAMQQSGRAYSRDDIKREITGHLCRCTGYEHVIDAIQEVVISPEKD